MATAPKPGKTARQQAVKRGPRRGPVVAEVDGTLVLEEDDGTTSQEQKDYARRTILEQDVARRIYEAMNARSSSGIEEIWQEDEDQYNGYDAVNAPQRIVKTRDQAPKRNKGGVAKSTLFLNITQPKTDTGIARVQEMLVPHDDKPWETKRTPMPELDEAIKLHSSKAVLLADGVQVPEYEAAEALNDKADQAAKKEGLWIEDKFVEGSVYAEMRKVIKAAGKIGTGVLKGPVPVERTTKKWTIKDGVGLLQVLKKIDPTSKAIRAQDCFPAPDCGDNIHQGSYFVERDFLTGLQLSELAGLPGYDSGAIAVALEEGPRLIGRGSSDVRRGENIGDTFNDAKLYEVFYYHGTLLPYDLRLLGLDRDLKDGDEPSLSEDDMRGGPMSCMLTMVNGRAVKCVLNPLETGGYPYDFFPWDVVDDQPWGRGIPRKIGVSQRGLNSAVRKQMENAGLSGGPQIVFDESSVEPMNGIYELRGGKLWKWKASEAVNDITKAFATFDIPSMQAELTNIISFWLEMCDILSNLPILMQGMLNEKATPETLGGLRLLMANMTSPLRVIAKQFDDYLIVPHLRRYHDWYMQDPNIPAENKGDTQIAARGATALVQRAEDSDFLVMLWASKDDPALQDEIDPVKLLNEIARMRGFNMATVRYTDDEKKKRQAERANQPPPVDPRVQAAQIRNDGIKMQVEATTANAQAQREFDAQQAAEDRAIAMRVEEIHAVLKTMESQGRKDISLTQLKGLLAKTAMDTRVRTDEMTLKLLPQNTSGTGI